MSPTPRAHLARAAILLGALWVLAGALFKLFDGSPTDLPSSLRSVLADLGIERGHFFRLAIAIEFAVVIAAVLRPRWGWIPLALLFAVFDAVLAPLVAAGEASCGCFGKKVPITPAWMMTIDSTLLVAILLTRPWSARPKDLGPAWLAPLLLVLSVPFPYFWIPAQPVIDIQTQEGDGGPTTVITGARFLTLQPEQWLGKDIFETDLARYLDWEARELPIDGLVVFYRWTCDVCAKHMAQVADQDDYTRPILLVRVHEEHDVEGDPKILVWPEGSHVTRVSLPRGTVWDVDTPLDLVLEGALVTAVGERRM